MKIIASVFFLIAFEFFYFFLVEEVLPSEEDGMAKKEKLSEESKKSPLSSANSLSPARKNPISTHTPVSTNGSQSMRCTSSLKVVETKSPIKSSQLEVEFEVQRESEGIFQNNDSHLMGLSFPLRFLCPTSSPESLSH